MTNTARSIHNMQQEFSNSVNGLASSRRKPSPRITLRLTEEENAKLHQMCEGITVSAYIRQRVFGGDTARRKRQSHAPVKDQAAMAQLLGLLGDSRIANNLNQLAFHANTGTLLIDDQAKRSAADPIRLPHPFDVRAHWIVTQPDDFPCFSVLDVR